MLTPAMMYLDAGAHASATVAKKRHALSGDIIECALRRKKVMFLRQRMLVAVRLQRKHAESERISKFLATKELSLLTLSPRRFLRGFSRSIRPDFLFLLTLCLQVALCLPCPPLRLVRNISCFPRHPRRISTHLPPSNGTGRNSIDPQIQRRELNRGASWLELTLDFVATT